MSIYGYTIFETVLEQNSFIKAASILNLTPSAVSHAIAKLERDVGFQLFIRNKNGISLTREAEKILPHIRILLHSNEILEQEINRISRSESGIIRIGTFNSITINWIPEIMKSFRQKHPNIEIHILQGNYINILEWIETSIVDLAFISNTVLPPHIESIPLHKDRIICVFPKGFVPCNPGYVTIEDIQNMSFVMPKKDYDQEVEKILREYHLNVYSQFHIDTDSAIVAMVEAGFGIAILSELIYKSCVGNVDTYPFVPEHYRIISLAYPNSQYDSFAVQKMKEHIVSYTKEKGFFNFKSF
ncbi:TPA: LysR family transcriptional regulator [Clostridioides difficile]|nr:LysR family transcriptional regulator [Clostridioides difficile]MCI9926556.1 LysR family transcriptional regulator [Clostridioides difficile]MCI9930348.1 LysR family transcriptional regulator [Clostridioides difficile]MDN9384539.1 LysR family transcriptional regulator [Clostridioides difficile]HBF3360948.1 LysR family transcriptional regulator [Clostridioides difficile]